MYICTYRTSYEYLHSTVINIFKFTLIHYSFIAIGSMVDGHFFIHFHTHGVEIRGRGGNSGKKGMADASGDGD